MGNCGYSSPGIDQFPVRPTILGAAVFTILYFLLFVCFLALYPDFIERYYNLPPISGIRLLGGPMEELMFAASGGAVWGVA